VHIVSRCARILAIRAEPDLNAENFSIIVVGVVLNNQERCHEHGHPGSDIKRDASPADRSASSGNRAHQQAKSDWQANERRVEDAYVGNVFVGIAQFSIGGTRLQPHRASMVAAPMTNRARSLGDAVISVVLLMS